MAHSLEGSFLDEGANEDLECNSPFHKAAHSSCKSSVAVNLQLKHHILSIFFCLKLSKHGQIKASTGNAHQEAAPSEPLGNTKQSMTATVMLCNHHSWKQY